MLYRKSDNGERLNWQCKITDVLKELKNSATFGHFGVLKTLQKLRELLQAEDKMMWKKGSNHAMSACIERVKRYISVGNIFCIIQECHLSRDPSRLEIFNRRPETTNIHS